MGTWCVTSIIAKNKPHAHHKTQLHTMRVCNIQDGSFVIKILLLFFDHRSVHLFQSNQHFQAIAFVYRPVPEKALNLSFLR